MTVFETYIRIEFDYVTSRFSAISLHCIFGHPRAIYNLYVKKIDCLLIHYL